MVKTVPKLPTRLKQHPLSGLWCDPSGLILMPPCLRIRRTRYEWTAGSKTPSGYHKIRYRGKYYAVHRLIAETFLGSPPEGKPCVDHIDRCKSNNCVDNLRWASYKENNDNRQCIEDSIKMYGVRACQDPRAYGKSLYRNNTKVRENSLARSRKWNAENHEKIRARARKCRKEQHEQYLAYGKAYRERKKLRAQNGAQSR